MQERKVVVGGGFTNSSGKKRRQRQWTKGKIYQTECRVPESSKKDKKVFLKKQCSEIEENNRMGKARDCFKKIGDTKGTFHARMGTIKGRNSRDLREAKAIKKGWKEYTEKLYKKDLNDPDNHDGVVTHLGHPGM